MSTVQEALLHWLWGTLTPHMFSPSEAESLIRSERMEVDSALSQDTWHQEISRVATKSTNKLFPTYFLIEAEFATLGTLIGVPPMNILSTRTVRDAMASISECGHLINHY